MKKTFFQSSVSIDEKTGKILAVYLKLREGDVEKTEEVCEGKAFADYDREGLLIGVELLSPCQASVWTKIAINEPEEVRNFLRDATPNGLVMA